MMMNRIDEIRATIAALESERPQLEANRYSRAELRESVERQVAKLARDAQEQALQDLRRLAVGRHSAILHADVIPAMRSDLPKANVGALLVALFGEKKVCSFLLADLDTIPEGLNKDARAERLEAIAIELDALEREEEALIVASEEAGETIARRAIARPEIVLGVPDTQEPKTYVKQSTDVEVSALNTPDRVIATAQPGVGAYSPR
jgi:hypothetical protein